jgi:hypothetical protein
LFLVSAEEFEDAISVAFFLERNSECLANGDLDSVELSAEVFKEHLLFERVDSESENKMEEIPFVRVGEKGKKI